ncbi:MAG: 50S ribosomal protein L32e [Methanobacteriota archaeon]|mgnify:CR=1 FL=1|nr:MAG: 50S ribosomal protein L32e [Euryarchaeota archaeon]
MGEYDDLTVAELKDLLREAGLPLSGKKADLVARLDDAGADAPVAEKEVAEVAEDSSDEADADDDFDDDDFDDEEEWDDEVMIHVARQKPELDDATKEALVARKAQYKKQPKFRRQEWYRYKRLSKTGWRKPKGYQSSQRLNRKYRSPMVRIGFGKVTEARGLHPSGFSEVMVHRPDDLEIIDPKTEAARIGKTVGKRKRIAIHEKADELGIRVLNRRRNI